MEYILETENLTKKFRNYEAVNQVSLHVKQGEIYGFIGKNGAGKTTFLKMVSGFSHPTDGEISLFGKGLNQLRKENLFRKVGSLIENPGLYGNLTAYSNLAMKCLAIGKDDKQYVEQLLDQVGLGNVGKKKVRQFSLGMRQRLGIALALAGEPEILLLDEPINGLDPQGIAEVRNTVLRLSQEKQMTIIISSHILEELSKIATCYGIIDKGTLIKELSKEELEEKRRSQIVIQTDNAQRAMQVLSSAGVTQMKEASDKTLYIMERLNETSYFNQLLVKNNVQVEILNIENQTIEEYYLQLTGGDRQ